MKRPDRSKIIDLFNSNEDAEFAPEVSTRLKQTTKKKQSGKTGNKNASNKARFERKLADENFEEFDHRDWYQYFVHKASEHGIRYLTKNYMKDYAIIKSILNEMNWSEMKLMIDFVFDSNQDIVEKRTVGVWIMSKGWINTTYNNALLWKEGKYRPKTAPKRNREWTGEPELAEASRKSSGLSYGKPIREEEEKPRKNVIRKGSIRL